MSAVNLTMMLDHCEIGRDERATSQVVAAFDVDLTLTRHDCVVPFLRQIAGWRLYPSLIRRTIPMLGAFLRRDRDSVKSVVTAAAVSGRAAEQIAAIAQSFAERVFPSWLREDTVKRLLWHRSQGHQIVLVSASYHSYLIHLARQLGCDAVLATDLEVNAAGFCTGRLSGLNCRGSEKSRRLLEWLTAQNLLRAVLYAYGDSSGDDQMLSMATYPVRVGKKPVSLIPEVSAV